MHCPGCACTLGTFDFYPFIHSLIHSFVHSLIHSFVHSFIHSLTFKHKSLKVRIILVCIFPKKGAYRSVKLKVFYECTEILAISVCNQGLGIESGKTLPSGFVMTSSSNQIGKAASSARLTDASSSWCAATNDQNQYLEINFGKVMTMTGIAIQGNPTANSWVKDFYFDYGMTLDSLVTYQEYGNNKVSV